MSMKQMSSKRKIRIREQRRQALIKRVKRRKDSYPSEKYETMLAQATYIFSTYFARTFDRSVHKDLLVRI
jgi:hypothetical protein